jgi:hypothetical protein
MQGTIKRYELKKPHWQPEIGTASSSFCLLLTNFIVVVDPMTGLFVSLGSIENPPKVLVDLVINVFNVIVNLVNNSLVNKQSPANPLQVQRSNQNSHILKHIERGLLHPRPTFVVGIYRV